MRWCCGEWCPGPSRSAYTGAAGHAGALNAALFVPTVVPAQVLLGALALLRTVMLVALGLLPVMLALLFCKHW